MSEIGIMPGRIVLDAPLPRSPARGLMNSPAAAVLAAEADHWQGGASLYPYPDALPDSIDPCSDGTFRQKLDPDGVDLPDGFASFTAYLGEVCNAGGIGDWDEFRARADVAMLARTTWALERQLAWGQFQADNPYLADADMQLTTAGTTPKTVVTAISYLEEFLAQFGQQGVIHVTPQVASALGDAYLIQEGQNLRTRTGTPVIVGLGYSDEDGAPAPAVSPALGAAGDGQSWIFGSSPVIYRVGPVISLPDLLSEALDRGSNDVVYRSERDLWVAFDGGPHAGVLADWDPT